MADTLKSLTVRFNLNNGVDADGDVKTISISAGSAIVPEKYNANDGDTKVLNIADALRPCLSKVIYNTQKSTVVILSRE